MREREAFREGKRMGKNRASWAFDGNTDVDTYRTFLDGWENGDPEVLDAYDPAFSIGEWAGESSAELGIEGHEDAFLDGFHEGYWAELECIARYHVGDES